MLLNLIPTSWGILFVMLKSFIRSLLIAVIGFGLFIVIGCGLTMVSSVIVFNSVGYCRDCNTGIGFVGIGFFLSIFMTPFVLTYVVRAVGLDDEPKQKRKNDELEDTPHNDFE